MAYRHTSAMLQEVMTCLACRPGGIYVDCTLGGAGHARAICEQILPDGLFIGIDQDPDAIANAQASLKPYAANIRLFHDNFIRLPDFLTQLQVDAVQGILLDLGLSQHQLEASGRGFTFQKDEPLDMRMDTRNPNRAQDLIADLPENDLAQLFYRYGEERWSKRIARTIVAARAKAPIRTTSQLVAVIRAAVPEGAAARSKIHPATRVFQALRIAVNQEIARLEQFLETAVDLLAPGGRMCVLSFHSLEDRLVKQRFKQLAHPCTCPPQFPQCVCGGRAAVRLVTKKALRPMPREIEQNPMARSTRLRCAEKLGE
ncbi:MAG: 16S rRNA (cytosine(1402)-N(4))-methyltransferase RsmH [Desulfobacterales bacterium]|nr:16S rRNA (cytosine(1402)-N(4))-methyltransferase RsmH [Desulfobacterales bacterium]